MGIAIEVKYTPNAKQYLFHECPSTEVVYGGAKGGGKSCALVMEALAYALEYKGAEIYLFRETYDDLEMTLIKEWKAQVPAALYKYNESKHIATLPNGSRVLFRYISSTKDADKYQGRSIDFIGVDELTKHEEESIQTLLSCVRSVKGFPARFRGTCNPGGIGHVWVRRRYINATGKGKKTIRDPITDNSLSYIPATVYDNHILMQNDPAYVKRLENLPPAKRKAFLEGDWDAYDGQAFEEWSPAIHVCEPFQIPKHWRRWRAADNGYTDPFAWYWFAVSEDGQVYIYREYTRDKKDPKISYSDQARRVVERSTYADATSGYEELVSEPISYTVVGHDAFAVNPTANGKAIIDFYSEGGIHGCIKAITDRRLRKATWHEYLKPYKDENTGKMTAKVQIFPCCKKLIETLPQQIEDEADPEKVAETDYDHWYDAAGYGLISWHAARSKTPAPDQGPIARHKDKLAKRALSHKRRRML